jgi:hypothetical protein
MKKELKKGNTKLSLGKMTVAKLRLSQQQMNQIAGGNTTILTSINSVVIDTEPDCTSRTTRTQV